MNPYETLGPRAFWRTAVADKSPFDISDLWQPKFKVSAQDAVATYGSCFAQHIGRALRDRGFCWLITETAPDECPAEVARDFNYGIFSSRTGNIYTTSLLHQWTEWALGVQDIPQEVWDRDGRFIDPFRPQIEPTGFASVEELRHSQRQTVASFRKSIADAKYFVFTLGLTESWLNNTHGYEYPMCPGTVAGEFSKAEHQFAGQRFDQVRSKLVAAMANIRKINPHILFILTVSPVPLTATASGKHVLVATMHSKSILRAVAGQLADHNEHVDYFPSYEIINSPAFGGMFFEPNKRSVNPHGVDFVMKSFFASLDVPLDRPQRRAARPAAQRPGAAATGNAASREGEVCEEALLDAFGARP